MGRNGVLGPGIRGLYSERTIRAYYCRRKTLGGGISQPIPGSIQAKWLGVEYLGSATSERNMLKSNTDTIHHIPCSITFPHRISSRHTIPEDTLLRAYEATRTRILSSYRLLPRRIQSDRRRLILSYLWPSLPRCHKPHHGILVNFVLLSVQVDLNSRQS